LILKAANRFLSRIRIQRTRTRVATNLTHGKSKSLPALDLQVLHSRPSTGRASLTPSLSLIGPFTPSVSGDSVSPPEVTCCSSLPCRPQTPWCGG
jgi:hypothetical protein